MKFAAFPLGEHPFGRTCLGFFELLELPVVIHGFAAFTNGPSSVSMNNSCRRRLDVFCSGARLRYRITVLSHCFQVHLNSAAHEFCGFLESEAACDTARQVRRVGAVSRSRFFVDNQVLHGFNPACSRMLLRVFGAASSEGWPAIVTLPPIPYRGHSGCWIVRGFARRLWKAG